MQYSARTSKQDAHLVSSELRRDIQQLITRLLVKPNSKFAMISARKLEKLAGFARGHSFDPIVRCKFISSHFTSLTGEFGEFFLNRFNSSLHVSLIEVYAILDWKCILNCSKVEFKIDYMEAETTLTSITILTCRL